MTTKLFLSHSSYDSKFALKICQWLRDFQFIKDIWIDIRNLKPGMEINESMRNGIMQSQIVIVIVSNWSKSKWVKQEIDFAKKKKKLIPILHNTKPELISPNNISFQQLLRKKHVSIDLNLFNIYELIPALIPDHHMIDVPLNSDFLVDQSRLIDNLRESSGEKKIYVLIKHKDFDKSILDAFKESVRELWNQDKESLKDLDILMKNLLPLFWSNARYALSKLVLLTISKRKHYTMIASMIHNLMQQLFYSLSVRFLDKVSLSLVNNNKNKKIKLMLREYSDYVSSQRGYDGGMNFLCHLYFNDYIQPRELVKFSFYGPNIKHQTAFVDVTKYRDLYSHYLPAVPLMEISELDWYKIIVPQFLCYEIMAKTYELEPFKYSDIDGIGLRLEDYQTVS